MEGSKSKDPSAKEKMNRAYLDSKINRIIEPMVVDLMKKTPDDPITYMIEWLKENHGNRASIHANERFELEHLRKEVPKLKDRIAELDDGEGDHDEKGSEIESEVSDEDDYVDDLPEPTKNKKNEQRTSVSAEVFGVFNKKGDFTPTVIEKSDEVKEKIRKRLMESFLFSALDEKDRNIVLDAMNEINMKEGDTVIKEGDDGDVLYVVESGKYKCTKVFPGNSEPTHLTDYEGGAAFGELALLYNAPRAATITCTTPGTVYSLDRQTFNHIVKDAAVKRREKYENFLAQVKILESLEPYERTKLADAFKEIQYKAGDYVIKEDEEGNTFYFISEGEAIATKTLEAGKPPVEVMQYQKGDYFGERALIKNEPRAANVIAKSDITVLCLDRHMFKRLLGPIEEILKRNVYEVPNQS
jgi:cAMP-dependent protein kinase regulator